MQDPTKKTEQLAKNVTKENKEGGDKITELHNSASNTNFSVKSHKRKRELDSSSEKILKESRLTPINSTRNSSKEALVMKKNIVSSATMSKSPEKTACLSKESDRNNSKMRKLLKKGQWDDEENKILLEIMQNMQVNLEQGSSEWKRITTIFNQKINSSQISRDYVAVKNHWNNKLNPAISQGPLTKGEREKMLFLYKKYKDEKNPYSKVAKEMGNKTSTQVRNCVVSAKKKHS